MYGEGDEEDDEGLGSDLMVGSGPYRAPFAHDDDPGLIGWPPTLPMEVALQTDPVKVICKNLGVSREQWEHLRHDTAFQNEVGRALEAVRVDGVGFKLRAQLQAAELLKTSWNLIHDPSAPPAVRARLIEATVRWGGLDASANREAMAKAGGSGFQILINLG